MNLKDVAAPGGVGNVELGPLERGTVVEVQAHVREQKPPRTSILRGDGIAPTSWSRPCTPLSRRSRRVRSTSSPISTSSAPKPEAPSSVDAETDAGNVDIDLPRSEYAVDLNTKAGDTPVEGVVRYDLAPHAVKARTDAGDIEIRGR